MKFKTKAVLAAVLIGLSINAQAGYTNLFHFDGTNAYGPDAKLAYLNGAFFGTTRFGGTYESGTIFRLDSNGVFSIVNSLEGNDDGYVRGSLVRGLDGMIYGTTGEGAGAIFRVEPEGLSFLHRFDGTNGSSPNGLVCARSGELYGTTRFRGEFGFGTVFRITTNGSFTLLLSFNGTNGANPDAAPLLEASDGNFYGVTCRGGASSGMPALGEGTVFRLTPEGTLTTLASFHGTNGAYPVAALLEYPQGVLNGTTFRGGIANHGTIFRIDLKGGFKTLHHFRGGPLDGSGCFSDLVRGRDGRFYGTTTQGGAFNEGTIFAMTPAGKVSVLHSFQANSGVIPAGGLASADGRTFMGSTWYGGQFDNGTIFRFDPPRVPLVRPMIVVSDVDIFRDPALGPDWDFAVVRGKVRSKVPLKAVYYSAAARADEVYWTKAQTDDNWKTWRTKPMAFHDRFVFEAIAVAEDGTVSRIAKRQIISVWRYWERIIDRPDQDGSGSFPGQVSATFFFPTPPVTSGLTNSNQ